LPRAGSFPAGGLRLSVAACRLLLEILQNQSLFAGVKIFGVLVIIYFLTQFSGGTPWGEIPRCLHDFI